MEKKPLKIQDGRIKEFSLYDDLPNQSGIDENKQLIAKLVTCLMEQGIDIVDDDLLELLNE